MKYKVGDRVFAKNHSKAYKNIPAEITQAHLPGTGPLSYLHENYYSIKYAIDGSTWFAIESMLNSADWII